MWITPPSKREKTGSSSWACWTYGLQAPLRASLSVYWASLKNEPQSLSSERNRGHAMISYTLLRNHSCLLLFRPLASVSIKTQWPSLPLLEDFSTSLWLYSHIVLLFFTSFHFLTTPKELASLGLCKSPLPFPSLPFPTEFPRTSLPPAWLLNSPKSGPAALPSLLVPDLCGTSHMHVQKFIISQMKPIIKIADLHLVFKKKPLDSALTDIISLNLHNILVK